MEKRTKRITDYFGQDSGTKRRHIDVEYEKPLEGKQELKANETEMKPVMGKQYSNLKLQRKISPHGAPPPHWENVWEGIREMRSRMKAPVDVYGARKLGDAEDPKQRRFQTFVGILLSSQTKDEETAAAISKLKKHGLCVQRIIETDEATLSKFISNTRWYEKKVKYLKEAAKILREKFNDDVPDTLEEIVKLPGIGNKMGILCLQCAWGKVVGISVDTHVHRISNRLGWVKNTTTPERTRRELESWLPIECWNEINPLFVGFGQTVCLPTFPKCSICSVKQWCPSANSFSSRAK